MDITKQEKLFVHNERASNRSKTKRNQSQTRLNRRALRYGVSAGLLIGLFATFRGFYITGNSAQLGFAKYLILAGFLGLLLYRSKTTTPSGETFKSGIRVGMLTSAIAAVTTAVASLISSYYYGAETISPYFGNRASLSLNAWTLAGVTLFEGIVAGMILTFIWLQLLKDPRRAR
jgi:hypothetical protein